MSSDRSDLWESLRVLDPQALTSIHQDYYPDVLRHARYRLSDPMVAEDLASDTFIQLIDALTKGKGPKTNVRGWLLATANNLINDYYRKLYKDEHANDLRPGTKFDDPVERIDHAIDTHRQLATALTHLTDEQQLVISLRFGADMSLDETARVMGKKINAIKALQYRAINALRKQMESSSYG